MNTTVPFHSLDDLPAGAPSRAVAIGVFDGVHRGHQALLTEAVTAARETGAIPAALTFDPHPAAVFSPTRVPPLLSTLEQRAQLLHQHGARDVVVAAFDRAFAARTPNEFVRDVLLAKLSARLVIVGDDFRYGCDRAGDVGALRLAGAREGFGVRVVPAVFVDGVPARSSVIRQMIAGGEVEKAVPLLGRSYTLTGIVVRGKQLGRMLGYPTANVSAPPGLLVPGEGVYAGRVRVQGRLYGAAISVGTNPTVAPSAPRTVEAFLLDGFAGDIYGQTVSATFVARLRGMEKFANLDELKAQMARDVEETKRRLANG